jgi:hypothetical protein
VGKIDRVLLLDYRYLYLTMGSTDAPEHVNDSKTQRQYRILSAPRYVTLVGVKDEIWLSLGEIKHHLRKETVCPSKPWSRVVRFIVNVSGLMYEAEVVGRLCRRVRIRQGKEEENEEEHTFITR